MDGEKLTKLRKERGISVFELATRSGVTPASIYNIEGGATENPRIDTVQKLAEALDCDVGELLRE